MKTENRDHKKSHEVHEDGRASLVCTEKNCAMELYTNRKNKEMENSMQTLGTELNGHKAWKNRSDLVSVPVCSKKIGNAKCGIAICDNNYVYNQRAKEHHDIYNHMDIDKMFNHEIYRKLTRFEDEDHGGWKRSIQTDYDFFKFHLVNIFNIIKQVNLMSLIKSFPKFIVWSQKRICLFLWNPSGNP